MIHLVFYEGQSIQCNCGTLGVCRRRQLIYPQLNEPLHNTKDSFRLDLLC